MNCHYCGSPLEEGREFCLFCGTKRPGAEIPMAQPLMESIMEPIMEPVRPLAEEPFAKDAWNFTTPEEEFPVIPVPSKIKAEEWNYVPDSPVAADARPRLVLPDRRGLGKMIFLGLITFGIYPTVIWSRMVTELNILASRHDGRRTMPYFAMMMLAPITLGIFTFVWMHKLCGRIEGELLRRDLDYSFGPRHFWLWNVLGSLILVGPFIFLHKLCKAMNLLNKDFNDRG